MYFLPPYRRGILNRYHKQMPLLERFTKDLSEAWRWWRNRQKWGESRGILAHPHFPSRGSTLYKIARELGYNVSNKPTRTFELVVAWEYLTFREEYQVAEKLSGQYRVLNLYNRDISKARVDQLHQEVFGYRTEIDPLTFQGKAVRKSDINAIHNYAVIDCPLTEREEGSFYQILINNEVENGTKVEDIRVPIIGGTISFAYRKHRDIAVRFKNPIFCRPEPIESLLSSAEIAQVNRLAESFRLDFGEMDVLRNRDDGRIYVIDVNNTPQGPPSGISPSDAQWAIKEMARHFAQAFLPNYKG